MRTKGLPTNAHFSCNIDSDEGTLRLNILVKLKKLSCVSCQVFIVPHLQMFHSKRRHSELATEG